MNSAQLGIKRVRHILSVARKTRVLVVGDVMLDQFIWGSVSRISPEAPVPVVDFARESFMPGGAANVARNLAALETRAELFGAIGRDEAARLAAVLPLPLKRRPERMDHYSEIILDRMRQMGW